MCPRRIPRTLLPLVATLVAAPGVLAQEPYRPAVPEPLRQPWRWRSFSPDVDASTLSLATGPGPTIWLGTRSGAARYDGRRWISYGPDEGLGGSPTYVVRPLPSGEVLAGTGRGLYRRVGERWSRVWPGGAGSVDVLDVKVGPDGTLWAGTEIGALQIPGEASTPTLFTSPRRAGPLADSLPGTRVRALPASAVPAWARSGPGAAGPPPSPPPFRVRDVLVEPDGTVWIAMATGELIRGSASGPGPRSWEMEPGPAREGAIVNPHLARGADGSIWLVTTSAFHGVRRYRNGRWTTVDLVERGGSHRNASVTVTDDGHVWIGGLGVVHRFDGEGWRVYQAPEAPVPTARTLLAQDEDGALWIAGVGQELRRVDYGSRRWEDHAGLLIQAVNGPEGGTWYVSDDGGVVREREGAWVRWDVSHGLMRTPMTVHPTSDGTVWAAGSHDGVAATARLRDGGWTRTLHPSLSWAVEYRSVLETRSGDVWFAAAVDWLAEEGHRGGILRYRSGEWETLPEPGGGVYGLAETPGGGVWAGGFGGLFRWEDGGWRAVTDPPALRGATVDALHADARGRLWVGTRQLGLFLRDSAGWRRFTRSDGLASDAVVAVTAGREAVWVATDAGISRYDGRSWLTNAFPEVVPASRRMVLRSGPDVLPRLGVLTFDPDAQLRVNRLEPPVRARTVRVNPDTLPPVSRMDPLPPTLSHPGNVVVSWSGSDPWKSTPPERLEYSHRVDGGRWSPFDRSTRFTLLDLPSGDHLVEVRARDVDMNVERVPASVTLTVAAPIWERAWFQALVALLVGGIAFQTYRAWFRGREIRRANEMLEERVRERTRALEEANRTLQKEIREREQLEARLIQAQKMEAVGRMAGGIAHDFNNLLTAVNGYTTLARAELEADHPAQEELSEVMEASERARSLVRQLLTFSRKQHVEPERVDVNEHLREVGSLLERLLGDGVELRTALAEEPLPVRIDPTRLEQAVVNLAVNARDAMRGAGRVTLRSARTVVAEESEELGPDASPGRHVTIAVEDDGPGIPEEHRDQIFEPFFSTKEVGSGLGLATVYGIVTQAGGFVRVESEIGVGTRFVLYFPEDLEPDPA